MNIHQILSATISFQTAIWLPIDQRITIQDLLGQIKGQQYKDKVTSLRALLADNDLEAYTMQKRNLPAVTFCGTFDRIRKKEHLLAYNDLLVVDIDKLSIPEKERVRQVLQKDPYVFAFWLSPSGNGFKGLISLDFQFELERAELEQAHKSAFHAITSYFESQYQVELDESGSDLTRLCFLSYDPGLVIKSTAKQFPIEKLSRIKASGPKSGIDEFKEKRLLQFKNRPEELKSIENVIGYLQATDKSITASYARWFRVAFALCEAFTFKVGLNYFLTFSQQDGADYDEMACRNLFYYCYKNSTGKLKLNTILYYAIQEGFEPQKVHPLKPDKSDEKNA